MVAYLCEQFPAAARRDDHISEIVGGRTTAAETVDAANMQNHAISSLVP